MPGCSSWARICDSFRKRLLRRSERRAAPAALGAQSLERARARDVAQDLHRQRAAQLAIPDLEHGSHATACDLATHLVTQHAGRGDLSVAARIGAARVEPVEEIRCSAVQTVELAQLVGELRPDRAQGVQVGCLSRFEPLEVLAEHRLRRGDTVTRSVSRGRHGKRCAGSERRLAAAGRTPSL